MYCTTFVLQELVGLNLPILPAINTFMENFTKISLDYDKNSIIDIISEIRNFYSKSCSQDMIEKINQVIQLKYRVESILYFNIPALGRSPIHIDENVNLAPPYNKFGLQLPLSNSDQIRMNWWQKKSPEIADELMTNPNIKNAAKHRKLKYENATLVDSVLYSQPIIVNISDYHSVENLSKQLGYFISLRFDPNISKDLIIQSLQ